MNNNENEVYCYIRRQGAGWTRGREHHKNAYDAFMNHVPQNDPVRVSVPHMDGGDFIASFSRVNNDMVQYIDEYNNRVEMMMCPSSYAAHINRVIDYF